MNIKISNFRVVLALLSLCVFAACSSVEKVCGNDKADDANWVQLFDGTTLDGWTVKCREKDRDKSYWSVDDGAIMADVPKGSKHHYIWLISEREYDNFELRMKVQSYAGYKGNSGVQIRSRYDDENGWLDGPQIDIHPTGPWRNGFIYDETREVKKWISPIVGKPSMAKPEHAPQGWKWSHAGDNNLWNDVHVICKGTKIKTIINGVVVVDYEGKGLLDDEAHRSHNVGMKGHICLQIHPGGPTRLKFRDVRVRKCAIAPVR